MPVEAVGCPGVVEAGMHQRQRGQPPVAAPWGMRHPPCLRQHRFIMLILGLGPTSNPKSYPLTLKH